jgi:hypothetical protein
MDRPDDDATVLHKADFFSARAEAFRALAQTTESETLRKQYLGWAAEYADLARWCNQFRKWAARRPGINHD